MKDICLRGILESNDQLTSAIFEAFDIASSLEIVAYPRNLTVSLKEYSYPKYTEITVYSVKKKTDLFKRSLLFLFESPHYRCTIFYRYIWF
ncbi:Uncharacterised protein [Mycobacteroides abscessus subsp. abscessus]|nr:Uncharacterised protein [Mycobacteroides abscessus subsp. abscessus]